MALGRGKRKRDKTKVPGKGKSLKQAVKLFLNNYDYICSIVKDKSDHYDLDYDEVLDFVFPELSKDNFGKIRLYEGRDQCKFKSYIKTVVTNLVYSFLRKKISREKKLEKVKKNVFDQEKGLEEFKKNIFDQEIKEPLEILEEIEEGELWEKALTHLPKILKNLDKEQQRAIKMKYYKGLKISTISRELKLSRHRVKRILEDAAFKIKGQLDEILKKRKNPGS